MAKATKIFLVEDNIGDVRLIKNSLEEMGIDHCCTVASNGVEALEHLNEKEGQKFVNKHDLIILDLNLPKKSGLEVLKEIKSIPGLKHIPVVIFSSSDAPAIVMFFLLRKIGEAKSRELLLTGKLVNADYMQQIGIINEIVEADKMSAHVRSFALKLAEETSPESIALTRRMIAEIQTMPTPDALLYAASQNATARATDDCKRGISAFLNKEQIKW